MTIKHHKFLKISIISSLIIFLYCQNLFSQTEENRGSINNSEIIESEKTNIENIKKFIEDIRKNKEKIKTQDYLTAAHIYRLFGDYDTAKFLYELVTKKKDTYDGEKGSAYYYLSVLSQNDYYNTGNNSLYLEKFKKYYDKYLNYHESTSKFVKAIDSFEKIIYLINNSDRNIYNAVSEHSKKIKEDYSSKSQISGSVFTEIEYVSIDNSGNNVKYDKDTPFKTGYVASGNLSKTQFSGIMVNSYNDRRQQKKLQFESLRFEFTDPDKKYIIGQYYPQYSDYTLSNNKIEGAQFIYFSEKYNGEFFAGVSNQYEKITDKNSTPEFQQYIYGLRTSVEFIKQHRFNLTMFGANDDKNSLDTGTPFMGPIDNYVYSAEYVTKALGNNSAFSLEYSNSILKNDGDSFYYNNSNVSDYALKTEMTYNLTSNARTKLQYKKFGNNYYTAGNPYLNSNYTGYDGFILDYEYSVDKYNFQGYFEIYDELEPDTNKLKSSYWIYNNTSNFQINDNENIAFTAYLKKSDSEDGYMKKFKTSLKLAYSRRVNRGAGKLIVSGNYSNTADKTGDDGDMNSKSISLTYNDKFLSDQIAVSSYLLGSKSEYYDGSNRFYMANTDFNFTLFPKKLLMLVSLGYKYNKIYDVSERSFNNKFEFKYYISTKNSLRLTYKNDRQTGGETPYKVHNYQLNMTYVF